ncbi:MAG: glycerol-3-phosphate dehydrogenase/oxidase [Acidimicrobiales bacterium]
MGSEVLDVVVVGGGITGAGVALDAVSRGLSVGLVEARDWASGSSSRSSKLIHGGLRYLEQFHFRLVREALRERTLLLGRLAPHLVRPLPFLYPLRHRVWERPRAQLGLGLYDLMATAAVRDRSGALPRHRYLGHREVFEAAPALGDGRVVGAMRYYDAEVDDARYTLDVVRTAASIGAKVASRTTVVGFLRHGGAVFGVVVRDEQSGAEIEVRARRVICAGGVWTDDLQAAAGVDGGPQIRMSKGVHLVFPKERLALSSGLIARTETSVLLVVPWGRHWIVGTTDTDWSFGPGDPAVSGKDIAYLIDHLNAELSSDVSPDDVVAAYAGLRPLLHGTAASPSELSREHAVRQPLPGLTVVAGGKFTTYRVMAADAVDLALSGEGAPRSRTKEIPLVGAIGFSETWARRAELASRAQRDPEIVEHLLSRYGTFAGELLELIADDPGMGETVPGAGDYLLAEVRYAASDEGALHLDDILERRTRIAIEYRDRGTAAADACAVGMGSVLGWSPTQRDEEVARYRRLVTAELAAQTKSDDEAANAELSAGMIGHG